MTSDKILTKIREILNAHCTKEYSRPITVKRLKVKDYEKHQAARIKVAEELADNIYNLSNLERVIDPLAYKSIFLRNLAGRTSEDNQFILKHAQDYFREHFGDAIKRNGESPELIEQVVKRTGKNTRAEFIGIIAGFNAPLLAESIYKIDLEETKNLIAIQVQLEMLGEEQLKELQAEIKIIPVREIAGLMHKFLNPNKVDIQSLRLLLQTKSPEEINKVITIFEESYLLKEGAVLTNFATWLEKNFAGHELHTIKKIMIGLDPDSLAEQINWIFNNESMLWMEFAGLQTQKSKTLILHVEHNHTQLVNLENEVRLKPFIHALIYYLNPTQFEILNKRLQTKYGYQLTKEFYLNSELAPLANYLKLEKALSNMETQDHLQVCFADYRNTFYGLSKQDTSFDSNHNFNLVLARLLFIYSLSNNDLAGLKASCQSNTKTSLREALEKVLLRKPEKNTYPHLIDLLDSGLAQKPVVLDINQHFDLLLDKHLTAERLNYLAEVEKKLIAQIDNFEISPEEKAVLVLNELQKLNKKQLIDIDELFHFKNDTSLLLKLKPLISPAAFLKIKVILSGFNPKIDAKEISENYNWRKLLTYSPLEIALLDAELKKTQNITLLEFLEKKGTPEIPFEITVAPAFYPLASQLKQKIIEPKAWSNLETDYILNNFSNNLARLRAVETAFNLLFCHQELSQESSLGSWRNSFLLQVQLKQIEKLEYVKLLSLTESIPITLIAEIYQITTDSELFLEDLHHLDLILRTHHQNLKIIKMLYLIYDGEFSLRERIYKFKVLPRDENLTLLLLDGYDPEKLARDLIIQFKSSNKLSPQIIFDLLNPERSNLIPIKDNWKLEMYHQLRVRYEIFSGRRLASDILTLVKDESELEIVRKIYDLLYGEMAAKCFIIHEAITSSKADPKLIVKKLQGFKPSQVEQMDHLYTSYYGLSLVEELVKFFPDDNDDRFAEDLFKRSREWEQEKLKLKFESKAKT